MSDSKYGTPMPDISPSIEDVYEDHLTERQGFCGSDAEGPCSDTIEPPRPYARDGLPYE